MLTAREIERALAARSALDCARGRRDGADRALEQQADELVRVGVLDAGFGMDVAVGGGVTLVRCKHGGVLLVNLSAKISARAACT